MAVQNKPAQMKRTRIPLTADQREKRDKERRAKFIELARKRMTNALNRLRQLESLGSYPHTDTEAAQMTIALREGVAKVERSLNRERQKTFTGFDFDLSGSPTT